MVVLHDGLNCYSFSENGLFAFLFTALWWFQEHARISFLRELWLLTVHFVTLEEISECYGTV